MARSSLDKWFKQKWVDIGSRKRWSHKPCGKSASGSRNIKCVPAACGMTTLEQCRCKKNKPQGVGGKPTNVKHLQKSIFRWIHG